MQFVVGTALDDAALVHDEDEVCVADCREAVRDREDRAVLHQVHKRILHELLRHRVEGARRLVKDENRRIADDRARDRDALASCPLPSSKMRTNHFGLWRV